MTDTAAISPHEAAHDHGPQGFASKYLFSTDHKVIAMQYLFTGMLMALVGGFFAYVFRMQLAYPGEPVPGFGVVSVSTTRWLPSTARS